MLAEFAALAELSTPHFKALFRATVGLPVHHYVVRRRVRTHGVPRAAYSPAHETFGDERGANVRPACDALLKRRERGQMRKIDADVRRPVRHREQIGVGGREVIAEQPGLRRQDLFEPRIIFAERGLPFRANLGGRRRIEQRRITLVHIGIDEREPLLQAVARHRFMGRREFGFGRTVREKLEDGGAFGQDRPVVEFECGHVALRIDAEEVDAALRAFRRQVDFFECDGNAAFARDDMGGKRARTRRVIELHIGS
ncbi:hypothetical protein PT2222_20112 [Paraburkholderia tropica]